MHVRFNQAWRRAQTTLQIKWSSTCNELHIDGTPRDLFSSILFMYPTILNVFKHGKRVKQSKTTYLVKFKWGRKQQTTIPVNPHVHILVIVLFFPKHTFRVIKHANWCHHVKLGIFLPHLHIKFIKFRVTVIKIWNKSF